MRQDSLFTSGDHVHPGFAQPLSFSKPLARQRSGMIYLPDCHACRLTAANGGHDAVPTLSVVTLMILLWEEKALHAQGNAGKNLMMVLKDVKGT
jgi:hypothetical protein